MNDLYFSYGNSCLSVRETLPEGKSRGTLVFLHGRFGDGEDWMPLVEELKSNYHCIVVDFPGFGRSSYIRNRPMSLLEHADLLEKMLDRMTAPDEKVTLIGHDIGGSLAQICVIRQESKFLGVVLVNSASLVRKLHFKTAWWEILRNVLVGNVLGGSAVRAIHAIQDSWPGFNERGYWESELKKVTRPVLLLWGNGDEVNPPRHGLELLRYLKTADFFQCDCGHWPQLEATGWVLQKMKVFIFQAANPPLQTAV